MSKPGYSGIYYGDWWKKGGLVSSSGAKSTSKDYYKSKYKSSLGYSSGLGRSDWYSYGYDYGYGYGYGGDYSKSLSTCTSGDFETLKKFLQRASRAARDLVIILDFPFDIRIDFNGYYVNATDKVRRIFVPTKIFDDKSTTDDEKVSLFCSLAIHEAAHLKYTEQRVFAKFNKEVLPRKYTLGERSLVKYIAMLIEDERIEDKLLQERPGYVDFIDKEKEYQYKTFANSIKSISGDCSSFLINLVKLIRFPTHIDEETFEEYKEIYNTIGNIILPLPDSTKHICEVAEEVLKCIKDNKLLDKINLDKELSEIEKSINLISYEILYGFDEDSSDYGDESLISKKITSIGSDAMDMINDLISGIAVSGYHKDTYFTISEGNALEYAESVKRVSKYVPYIRKLIAGHDRNYDFAIHGCRSGLLDTNKLAEAYQGIPQVYIRKGSVRTNKTTVCVLIDESGSMAWNHKDRTARDTAILLNEAFKTIPGVDLYIYGHSGDIIYSGSTELMIYKEGNSKNIPKTALGCIEARSENRDGTAIYETAKRVRKFTDSNVLMFIISDGSPAADRYWGEEARMDVKQNVEAVEKMGFTTVAITIEGYREAKEMYPRNIDLSSDLSVFPQKLSQIVKNLVISDKKTTIIQ